MPVNPLLMKMAWLLPLPPPHKKPGGPCGPPGGNSIKRGAYFFFRGTLMTGLTSAPQIVASPESSNVLLPITVTFLLS